MDLYIRQRVLSWGDKYDITDDREVPVYRVEGEVFTFGAKLHLYDRNGQELYYVEQEVFHFMPRYTVYKGGLAVASVRKNFTLFGHSLAVESGYGHFEIEGSVFGWDFQVLCNGVAMATVEKAILSWGDTYHLHLDPGGGDPAFFCALVAAIDNCVHNGSQN